MRERRRSWLAEELSLFSEITIKVIILITIPNEGRRWEQTSTRAHEGSKRERDRIIKKGTGIDRQTDIHMSKPKQAKRAWIWEYTSGNRHDTLSLSLSYFLSVSFLYTHTNTPAHTHYTVVYGAHNTSTLKMYFNVSPALPFRLPVVIFNVFHLLQRRMMGVTNAHYTHTHTNPLHTHTHRETACGPSQITNNKQTNKTNR